MDNSYINALRDVSNGLNGLLKYAEEAANNCTKGLSQEDAKKAAIEFDKMGIADKLSDVKKQFEGLNGVFDNIK